MINENEKPRQTGQAIIEFLIVLPSLLFLMAAIFPLVRYGALTLWLDERLWLNQFVDQEQIVQTELSQAHRQSLVPVYFREGNLAPSESSENFGFYIPSLGSSFPGSFHVEHLFASWEEKSIPFLEAARLPNKISREFSMLKKTYMPEKKIPSLIREKTLSRFVENCHWLSGFVKLDVFHLNLNILPE